MKIKDFFTKSKKRTFIIICGVAGIIGVVVFCVFAKKGDDKFFFGNMQMGEGQNFSNEGTIMASGVINVGTKEEIFGVENLNTVLEIEEVYVKSEEEIEIGTKLLKLSEESVAAAREELKQKVKDTELAYRLGTIEYQQSKINAVYDRDSKILSGEQAQAVYDQTVSNLEAAVEKAKSELTTAQNQIAVYQSYVSDNSYKSYFKVDEYQATYDATLAALKEKMEEWGVTWEQVTGQGSSNNSGNNTDATMPPESGTMPSEEMEIQPIDEAEVVTEENDGETGDDIANEEDNDNNENNPNTNENVQTGPSDDQILALSMLYDVLELQLEDLQKAQAEYEDALENDAFELQTLLLELPTLELALEEANKEYETKTLEAKLTYETTLSNAQSAESDYTTAISKAENDYETLKDDWEDAKENLELFEESVGDGYYYATGSGTILRMMVRYGGSLTSESTILMYSNPEEMTVTVSVAQEKVSSITINDSVYIQSETNETYEGTIVEINPISDSTSRTNITYNVVVQITGEIANLSANDSVTVIWGMDRNDMKPEEMGNGMVYPQQSEKERAE